MRGDMRLHKQNIFFRIKSRSNQKRHHIQAAVTQHGRLLADRNRMQIHHAVITVVFFLKISPVFHSSQVIAQRKIAGRLYSTENNFFVSHSNPPQIRGSHPEVRFWAHFRCAERVLF